MGIDEVERAPSQNVYPSEMKSMKGFRSYNNKPKNYQKDDDHEQHQPYEAEKNPGWEAKSKSYGAEKNPGWEAKSKSYGAEKILVGKLNQNLMQLKKILDGKLMDLKRILVGKLKMDSFCLKRNNMEPLQ